MSGAVISNNSLLVEGTNGAYKVTVRNASGTVLFRLNTTDHIVRVEGNNHADKFAVYNASGDKVFNVNTTTGMLDGIGIGSIIFGSGADGDQTLSNTSLTRDMYFNNLTINGTVHANGYRIFVRGTLTINAPGVLHNGGSHGGDTNTGGAAGSGGATGTLGGGGNGGSGTGDGTGETVPNAIGGGANKPSAADGWIDGEFRGFDSLPNMFTGLGLTGTKLYGGDGGHAGGGAGGGGGGGVLLVCAREIVGNGLIHCNGGNGGQDPLNPDWGGLGGDGGYLLVITLRCEATLSANAGGAGFAEGGTGRSGTVKLIT